MFTGETVDTRSSRQRQLDARRAQVQQAELFSQRDLAQFGVSPRPLIPLSPSTKLALVSEDVRTSEERERDLQQEAAKKTTPLFQAPYDREIAHPQE